MDIPATNVPACRRGNSVSCCFFTHCFTRSGCWLLFLSLVKYWRILRNSRALFRACAPEHRSPTKAPLLILSCSLHFRTPVPGRLLPHPGCRHPVPTTHSGQNLLGFQVGVLSIISMIATKASRKRFLLKNRRLRTGVVAGCKAGVVEAVVVAPPSFWTKYVQKSFTLPNREMR